MTNAYSAIRPTLLFSVLWNCGFHSNPIGSFLLMANSFFANSEFFDGDVLRPLSHIRGNWEITWNGLDDKYEKEEGSYAKLVNELILEIDNANPPAKYHDNEDRLAQYTKTHLKWNIRKEGNRWVGMDYHSIIEQGGFHDIDEKELVQAAAGRIYAARLRGQNHFDKMEESHRRILATVLSIILYHRSDDDNCQ
jgi:hypothetical protein